MTNDDRLLEYMASLAELETGDRVAFMEKLNQAISSLPEREQKVLRLRLGIDDNYPRTLQEIGTMYNCTRERVRQIEARAKRKLVKILQRNDH